MESTVEALLCESHDVLFSLRCIIKSVQTNLRENWGTWLSISNQTVDAFVNRTFWDCSSYLSFACDMCLCPSIFYTSPTFSGIRYFGAFGADHIPIHCQYAEKSKISFMFQLDPETKSTPSISIFRTRSPARPQVRPTSSGSTCARVALSFPDSSCQHNSSITSKRDSVASWYNISDRTDRPGKNTGSAIEEQQHTVVCLKRDSGVFAHRLCFKVLLVQQ